jgi:Gpi18-like mannosyltransferase
MSRESSRFLRPIPREVFLPLMAAYLLLRLWMATLPGYVNDVQSYKEWAAGAATRGLPATYESTGADYPPLFLYQLWAVGKVYLWVQPEVVPGQVPDSRLFTLLIKTPHIVFDLLLGLLLYSLVATGGLWGRGREGPGFGRLAALLYLMNPAVLFGSAYWGQPDGIHSFLAVAAMAALGRARLGSSGVLLSFGALMKPLAAPLVPLLALASLMRRSWRGVLLAGGGGLAAAVLSFMPFIVTGRLPTVLRRVLFDVEAMPFTSVNGHNLWWLIGAWQNANRAILGPLTPKQIALTLFGLVYLALLARSLRWIGDRGLSDADYSAAIFRLAAAITAAFFFLSTHMHENHLFMALPLLICVAGKDRLGFRLTIAASVAISLNMMLHDPELPYRLPFGLATLSPFTDPHLGRAFTWLQVIGSFADSLLVGGVAVGTFYSSWRRR